MKHLYPDMLTEPVEFLICALEVPCLLMCMTKNTFPITIIDNLSIIVENMISL